MGGPEGSGTPLSAGGPGSREAVIPTTGGLAGSQVPSKGQTPASWRTGGAKQPGASGRQRQKAQDLSPSDLPRSGASWLVGLLGH